jgi:hypothetical protein
VFDHRQAIDDGPVYPSAIREKEEKSSMIKISTQNTFQVEILLKLWIEETTLVSAFLDYQYSLELNQTLK